MSVEPARFVLDSFSLLAFLQGEPGMRRVKAVLLAAEREECRVYVSWINLGEVLYIVEREKGLQWGRETLARLQELPIQMLEATSQMVLEAAHIKANHAISYADAFAAAAALREGAVLLTGDMEFETIQSLVRIEWLET